MHDSWPLPHRIANRYWCIIGAWIRWVNIRWVNAATLQECNVLTAFCQVVNGFHARLVENAVIEWISGVKMQWFASQRIMFCNLIRIKSNGYLSLSGIKSAECVPMSELLRFMAAFDTKSLGFLYQMWPNWLNFDQFLTVALRARGKRVLSKSN